MTKLTLTIFPVVLLAAVRAAYIKILDTPDGQKGNDPCVTVCSGVDKDYGQWTLHSNMLNPIYEAAVSKDIDISGCDFAFTPVVTAVSGSSGVEICPSFTVPSVAKSSFKLVSTTTYIPAWMSVLKCKVYWTATGYTC